MSSSRKPAEDTTSIRRRILQLLLRISRSWVLGLALTLIAMVFVYLSWRSIDFSDLRSVSLGALILAAIAYATGLLLLAGALVGSVPHRPIESMASALAAQLFKYVPGAIWQGQRLFAVGGLPAVAQFAATAVVAAGLGLVAGATPLSAITGLATSLIALLWVGRHYGWRVSSRVGVFAVGVVSGIALSGGLLGWGMGLDPSESARDITGAWSFGTLILPVPAGLGMREFYLSVAADPAVGARLALGHRILTTTVDLLLGSTGVLVGWSFRRKIN